MTLLPVVHVHAPTYSTECVGRYGKASSCRATWEWPAWNVATFQATCRCISTSTALRARCSFQPHPPELDVESPATCSFAPSGDWTAPAPDQHRCGAFMGAASKPPPTTTSKPPPPAYILRVKFSILRGRKHLKSGMTYHFRSDGPLHSTASSAT